MKYCNYCILSLFTFLSLWACDQKEEFDYTAGNQIYFTLDDSVVYSFAVQASTVETDTVFIPIAIHGLPSLENRTVNIRIDEERSTALRGEMAEGGIYQIGETVLPSGEWETALAVRVFRQPSLKDKEFEVYFYIEPGQDFIGGMGSEKTFFKLKINNILTKPDNWDNYIAGYFGTYGPVKYQFIIDVLGRYSFPEKGPDAVVKAQMSYYRDKLRTELIKYEKVNGPLMEGAVKVNFD